MNGGERVRLRLGRAMFGRAVARRAFARFATLVRRRNAVHLRAFSGQASAQVCGSFTPCPPVPASNGNVHRVRAGRPVRYRQPFPEPARRAVVVPHRGEPRQQSARRRRGSGRGPDLRPLPRPGSRATASTPQPTRRARSSATAARCMAGLRAWHDRDARRHARRFGRPQHHRCRYARRERPHRPDADRSDRLVRERPVDARHHASFTASAT